jgi:hypothetical protein
MSITVHVTVFFADGKSAEYIKKSSARFEWSRSKALHAFARGAFKKYAGRDIKTVQCEIIGE